MTISNTSPSPNQVNQSPDTNRIRKLPLLLVNQLAAGEVVTRPASVVKELIENAIDAGAKTIDIRITQGGMGSIEVADDGCGIHPDDMVMAVTRFATSKIADVAHLQGIATLGFRGEALAATASVSRLTLTSSADNSGVGRELNVAGILDDTPVLTPVVHPKGTTVTVKDLYFNVPARRGNLKSISTEYAHIEVVVKHLALVASDVSFSLWHNDKRRFNFEAVKAGKSSNISHLSIAQSGSSLINTDFTQSVLVRLKAILSASPQSSLIDETQLQPITIDLEGLRPNPVKTHNTDAKLIDGNELNITGFLIPSFISNANTSFKLLYINGRLVKDRRIAQIMRESSGDLNSLGYVLFFNLPKAWLNLNVHPSKQCIKIQNLANITAHLKFGVRDALLLWYKCQDKPRTPQLSKHNTKPTISQKKPTSFSSLLLGSDNYNNNDSYHNKNDRGEPADQYANTTKFSSRVNETINHYATDLDSSYDSSLNSSIAGEINNDIGNVQLEQTLGLPSQNVSSLMVTLPVKCLYLMDSSTIEQQFIDDCQSSKSEICRTVDDTVVLIQISNAVFIFNESKLLNYIENNAQNDSDTTQLVDEYLKFEDNHHKLTWLNGILNQMALLQTQEESPLKSSWVEKLSEYAIGKVSFPKLIGLILKHA